MYTIYFHSTDEMIGFLGRRDFDDSDECAEYIVNGDWGIRYPAEKCGEVYMTISFNGEPLGKGAMLLVVSLVTNALDISEELDAEHKRRAMESLVTAIGRWEERSPENPF